MIDKNMNTYVEQAMDTFVRHSLMSDEFLDFVNAGGSSITTSNFSPAFSSSGNLSNTSAHSNLTVSESPLSSAFFIACSTPSSDASRPSTLFAPA